MDLGLKGKNVLVCAASDGIAFAAARGFAREGARVAICARNEQKLAIAAEALRAEGAQVLSEALDVADAAAVAGYTARVAREFGGIDVCVTNAGGPPPKKFAETTPAEWQRAYEQNLQSIVLWAQAVLPGMQQKGWGRLITLTSSSVRQPVPDLVYSNTIRAGVLGLVKTLSNEYGAYGITVNNVAPGYTATGRLLGLVEKWAADAGQAAEEYLAQLGQGTALQRVARPEEVADAIVWLASERASYVTGQTLLVDGGLSRGL